MTRPANSTVLLDAPGSSQTTYHGPKWDWYQATIHDGSYETVRDLIATEAGTLYGRGDLTLTKGVPVRGYGRSTQIDVGGQSWCTVYGGEGRDPMVRASGAASPDVALGVRWLWSHQVSRADTAIDLTGAGTWEWTYTALLAIAEKHRLCVKLIGDPLNPHSREGAGRTLYLGTRSSGAMLRLYEKGRQLWRAKGPARETDLTWVRAELEVRPLKSHLKKQLARLSPLEAWGVSRWSQEVLEALTGHSVPSQRQPTSSSVDAFSWMCRQYGKTILQTQEQLGLSDEQFGVYLVDRAREWTTAG